MMYQWVEQNGNLKYHLKELTGFLRAAARVFRSGARYADGSRGGRRFRSEKRKFLLRNPWDRGEPVCHRTAGRHLYERAQRRFEGTGAFLLRRQ